MADKSFTYCDSDEELFFGKETEKELVKRALFGQNYNSPAVKLNAPGVKSTNLQSEDSINRPDILNEEVPVHLKEVENSLQSNQCSTVNSSDCQIVDDDVIIIDVEGQSDYVQIISDDESFIINEEHLTLDSSQTISTNKSPSQTGSSDRGFENKVVIEENRHKNVDPVFTEALNQASVEMGKKIDNHSVTQETINPLTENAVETVFSDAEYTFLDNVTDSILNISHGSSFSSSGMESINKSSLDLQTKNILYEDISCDGEQMIRVVSEDSKETPEYPADDLHMSIDDPSNQQPELDNLTVSSDISQPSLYKSCLSNCNNSSYYTVENMNSISQMSSCPFHDYRENINDSLSNMEMNDIGSIEKNDKNEAAIGGLHNIHKSPLTSASKIKNNQVEDSKQKTTSKLPVFHGSGSLLKPPKLNVKTENSTNNYEWAKNLSKLALSKTSSSLGKHESNQTSNLKLASVGVVPKISVTKVKQNRIEYKATSVKTGTHTARKAQTPDNNKTPSQSFAQPMKLAKLDAKNQTTPRFKGSATSENNKSKIPLGTCTQPMKLANSATKFPITPRFVAKGTVTSEKKKDTYTPLAQFQGDKNMYKDVISPVRAYISGSPTVLTKSAQCNSSSKANGSYIPVKLPTPLKNSKVVQSLNYGSPNGQENVDPNYKRDTLPPRVLSTAEAVFFKDPELPKKHLPKMGGSMKKLLDTPRPKIVIHQGRVIDPPKMKGVLIQNTNTPKQDPRISVRVVKSPVKAKNLE